jgi:hypothetical protein
VIHIRTPDDSVHAKKDVPCTLALQFFIRDEKLHLHVNMRSSDIILGIAYDVPAFTLMQEVLANELGVGLGEYCHTSNSLHCYERDFAMLSAIADTACDNSVPMPPLPRKFPTGELLQAEESVDSMTEGEFLDGLMFLKHPLSEDIDDESSSNLIRDWKKILCSFRSRKLKDEKLAHRYIISTSFKGYHFFKR